LGFSANAEWNQSIGAGYRSVPQGQNIQGTVAYDKLLWGEVNKERPLYGYLRAGIRAGGAPTAAVFLQVAPVAPLIFEVQRGATYRYTPSQIFDCKNIFCYGVTERTDVSVKIAFGYGSFVGYASYLWRGITLPESSNPVLAEIELVTASMGNHGFNEYSVAAGIKMADDFAGLIYSHGVFSENKKRSESAYAVYSRKFSEFDLSLGAGTYNTDESDVSGSGVILTFSKRFGESLSLF
jgi:hypothetical protein